MKFTEEQREKIGDVVRKHDPYYNPKIDELVSDIEQIINERDEWVRIEDGLPKSESMVIAFDGEAVFVAYYDNYYEDEPEWQTSDLQPLDNKVTHWKPLPNKPLSKP